MKKTILILLLTVFSVTGLSVFKLRAEETNSFQVIEFITIRWQGRDDTKVIRPNGKVESLKALFERAPKPDGIDERAYYMNVAMNAFAKDGYDFAGMNNDVIIMRRKTEKTLE